MRDTYRNNRRAGSVRLQEDQVLLQKQSVRLYEKAGPAAGAIPFTQNGLCVCMEGVYVPIAINVCFSAEETGIFV